jgi:hypothetical protein
MRFAVSRSPVSLLALTALASACTASVTGDPLGSGARSSAAGSGTLPGAGGGGGRAVGGAAGSAGAPVTGGTGGSVGGGATGGSSGASGSGADNGMPLPNEEGHLPYAEPAAGPEVLPARTWKLTHLQYKKSVQALLGATVDVSDLEPELDNGVYPNMSGSGLVRVPLATGYYDKAKTVTDGLSATALAALVPGGQVTAAAKATFIPAILEKAFRRPAGADEVTAYGAVFDIGASGGDVALGFRAVLRSLLTSPHFLYRTEIGADAALADFNLTGHEVASLLSYSLLDGPPTAELLAAAARGELTSPATLATVVSTLLGTPEAAAQLATFAQAWLKVYKFETALSADTPPYPQKDVARFPNFDSVRQAMFDESAAFLGQTAGPTGTLAAVLTTPLPMPTGALGSFYLSEASGSAGGTRMGVLALGTVLSMRAKETSTSPTLRGLFVRDRFLCQEIHLPDFLPPDISETQMRDMPKTTRELYERHAASASCAGCHDLLDSVGFTFENLDAAGRFRTQENGVTVDTSGELLGTDVDGPLVDHTSLATALAKSEWVRECVATQAFRFYFGQVEANRGVPAVQAARRAIGSGTFRDLVSAVMATASTYHRVRK